MKDKKLTNIAFLYKNKKQVNLKLYILIQLLTSFVVIL